MEVKICGITSLEDGEAAVRSGADAVGFVFYPPSPRRVTPDRARDISRELGGRACRVGVFVNEDAGEVRRIQEFCGLDLVQLHGDESPEYCGRFTSSMVIKAVSLRNEADLAVLKEYRVRALLVDAHDPKLRGGTGKTCDWNLARKAGKRFPLILSGGLNAGNIAAAIQAVGPLAVDIGSGVEVRPGKKDPEKMKGLFAAIKGLDPSRASPSALTIFPKIAARGKH